MKALELINTANLSETFIPKIKATEPRNYIRTIGRSFPNGAIKYYDLIFKCETENKLTYEIVESCS